MFDFTILTEYFVLVVFAACLVVGYCLKHGSFFEWINNNNIPVILSVFSGLYVEKNCIKLKGELLWE